MDCRTLFRSSRSGDPDSTWQMQHRLMSKNKMYKFVDLHMGGQLIEAVTVSPASPVSVPSAPPGSVSVDSTSATSASVNSMSAMTVRLHSVSPTSVSLHGSSPSSTGHSGSTAPHPPPVPYRAWDSASSAVSFAHRDDPQKLPRNQRPAAHRTEPDPPSAARSEENDSMIQPTPSDTGVDGVKRIAENKLKKYLYNKGKGAATVTELNYEIWLQKMKENIESKQAEAWDQFSLVEYKEDAFNRFEPHQACWDLTKRGWMGETPLLMCYIMNTPEHLKVAKVLLELFPAMALDVYEGREFFGESALHIAIANGDLESVKLLVQRRADIKQRATGRFFRPDDQKDNPDGDTDYKGSAYYGEYPLAFAASRGDIAIYDFLLKKGAEPNMKDNFGNTVLHMAVIHDQPDMFFHAVTNDTRPACLALKNKRNLTPLTLACKMGRARMFRLILDLCSVENWRFGDITCSFYPLATLDSIDANGEIDWQSALCYIVKGDTDGHLEMLEGAVVQQLLREKEETYANKVFYLRLSWAVLHLIVLSTALYLRPAGDQLLHYTGWTSGLRFTCEVLVCLSCLLKLIEAAFEIHYQGLLGFLKNWYHAPAKTVYLASCVLVMLCVIFRGVGLHVVEDVLLMFAVLGAWVFLFFFARGFERTGPFVVMISQMLRKDLLRFFVIYLIFVVGFTSGFFFLFRDVTSTDKDVVQYLTFDDIILNLFLMTLGEFKYEVFSASHYPVLAKLVFVVFMILMSLLLLQMLIAMMGNTYMTVIKRARREWQRQWANTVLVLERTSFFTTNSLKKYQEQYSKQLDASSRPRYQYSRVSKTNARALMVVNKPDIEKTFTSTWLLDSRQTESQTTYI